MKKLIFSALVVFVFVLDLFSQEYYQQSNIEMSDSLDSDKSYVCEASNCIRLLPGFQYRSSAGNDMSFFIDRYSVFPPIDGYYGNVSGDIGSASDAVVGSLPSAFNVDNAGAAVYSIDLNLPSAIGTMMPKLALTYNNQRGNGLMGWSWDVDGLSEITRVGQTEYHDGKITNVDFVDDRFAIDGQRLFALDGAVYGADGTVYKTEVDNMDKIVSFTNGYNGPEYFVVWKNDGMKWEYGTAKDSRMVLTNVDKTMFKWMLSKISDRDGNSVLFHYDINNTTGESYINNIEYTVNDRNGLEAAYKIVFEYELGRSDAWGGYVSGNTVACKRLLKNIRVLKNDTQKVLFDYSFEYYEPAYYGDRYFMYYRLKSIGLAVGDKKINPTKIIWNDEKKHYPQSQGFQIYELDKSMFTDIPFIGDFNGDGLSDILTVPYKVQKTYPNPIKGKVYLNKGNGSFGKDAAIKVTFLQNLDWIYVVDLNGDGKDDIVTYEYNYDYKIGDDVLATLNVYLLQNGSFVKKAIYRYNDNISVVPGCFVSNDKSGLLVFTLGNIKKGKKKVDYITFDGNTVVKKNVTNIEPLDELDVEHVAIDMNGDGVAELVSMEKNGSYINKLVHNTYNDTYNLKYYSHCIPLKKDMYLFPNDFNGDGKTDILYYDAKTYWNVLISRGCNFTPPMSCNNTVLLGNVVLNAKDRYRCSLNEMMEPTVSIRTADFDGDGTSDVAVFRNTGGNYYLQIGFMPYKKNNKQYDFTHVSRYYMPINYSHQCIHIGRFLPQENVSFISSLTEKPYALEKPYVVSLYPHSMMYSVERITDGLGNTRGFSYDCLMQKDNSGFYTSDNDLARYGLKRTGIPLRALKTDTVYNINDKPVVTEYEYNNALIHPKGHGFLAFERTVSRTFINGECVMKQIQENEFNTMGRYCMLLPSSMKVFQGENELIKEVVPRYRNYLCESNPKVVMPLLTDGVEMEYNRDKQGCILKKTIVEYDYRSDNASDDSYDKVLQLVRNAVGYTDDASAGVVKDCPYWEEKTTEYDNDLEEWILNRPVLKKRVVGRSDEDDVGEVESLAYDKDNLLRVASVTKVPNVNGDFDSLSISVDYEYDAFGHIVQKVVSSPSLKHKKTLRYEYGEKYQHRYLTKTIDEMGREISCDYDDEYGMLTATVDYNRFATENVKDPLGVDDVLKLSDDTQHTRSLRWSHGNEYSPPNASYYYWEKSTGDSETMRFYHKSGCELRTVTFDINGNAVFRDKCYDDFGNICQETLPYYTNDEKKSTSKKYDKYNRVVEVSYPNDLRCEISYDGNQMVSTTVSENGGKRTKTDKFNVMGWLVGTTDAGGNMIAYDYYSDGLLKSALINDNINSRIVMKYDNNRNRSYMYDPNYGTVRYVNDALGNIKKVIKNDGDTSEFEYDCLGRKVCRRDVDVGLEKEVVTYWQYYDQRGKNGMLKKVSNGKHSIEYFYDDKLRLVNTIETIDDVRYNTSYTYDKANRISTIAYPTGLTLLKTYSNTGYERASYDKDNETLLWNTIKTNAYGCVTECQYGNGVKTINSYDPKTSMIVNIYTSKDGEVLQDLVYEYDDFGNVVSRSKKSGKLVNETFEYDKYDRLTKTFVDGKMIGKMVYDNRGNIVSKDVGGERVLYDAVYVDKRPYNILEAKTDKANLFSGMEQDVCYSVSDDVVKVASDNKTLDISYGCEQSRISMKIDNGSDEYSKVYVGNNEFVDMNGTKAMFTYLIGPMGVYGVYAIDGAGDESITYVHKDNIDSWETLTDGEGHLVQQLGFDAWGNRRDPDDWSSAIVDEDMMFDRGYTGHEHISDFGLINMNGRMYDPVMSMMLSPDNNIQMPQMSQNFNRYSYCLNNPLKYNDPTGEWVESVLLGVVFGASNVVFNADEIDTFTEGLLLFGAGFAQGFLLEYTMGQSWYIQVGANTIAGTLKSGVNEIVSVGDGSFNLSGDDWNAVAKATYYGLGSSLVSSVLNSYINSPTENCVGDKLRSLFFGNEEVGYAVTSLMAHGMGCWFSGQPMLLTMSLKDVGFDLGMLSIVVRRLMGSYVYKSGFAEEVVEQRAQEIKDKMLADILSEDPDHGDFEMKSELLYVDISAGRIYVSGNMFAMLPGEMFKEYPKPYLNEVVSFPFSYSLFRALFFNK